MELELLNLSRGSRSQRKKVNCNNFLLYFKIVTLIFKITIPLLKKMNILSYFKYFLYNVKYQFVAKIVYNLKMYLCFQHKLLKLMESCHLYPPDEEKKE